MCYLIPGNVIVVVFESDLKEGLEESIISRLNSIVTEQFDIGEAEEQQNNKTKRILLLTSWQRVTVSDKRFRRELASWIHSNRSHSKDGMPGYAFGYSDITSYMGPFVTRTFDNGKGQAAKDRQLATGSPVLAVLGTEHDEPIDWLQVVHKSMEQ